MVPQDYLFDRTVLQLIVENLPPERYRLLNNLVVNQLTANAALNANENVTVDNANLLRTIFEEQEPTVCASSSSPSNSFETNAEPQHNNSHANCNIQNNDISTQFHVNSTNSYQNNNNNNSNTNVKPNTPSVNKKKKNGKKNSLSSPSFSSSSDGSSSSAGNITKISKRKKNSNGEMASALYNFRRTQFQLESPTSMKEKLNSNEKKSVGRPKKQ